MTAPLHRRKLIEVALPLDEINAACKADKGRAHGTIKNLHKWFAPAPVPAWRALLFAALVDDPEDDEKRAYLLDVIKRLVVNGADVPDASVLVEARQIIAHQFPEGVPAVADPFCGGGSTLIEAQRLGLTSFASDLNPVPVLITRTLTQLLPKVYSQQPLHPQPAGEAATPNRSSLATASVESELALMDRPQTPRVYSGYDGLAQDVTHYASAVLDKAWGELANLFPTTVGETNVAWLWARTVMCPNPACGIETVLTTNWWLSKKKNALAWIAPSVRNGEVHLEVLVDQRAGGPPDPPKLGRGASFECLRCKQVIEEEVLVSLAATDGLGLRMLCVMTQRGAAKEFRSPTERELAVAGSVVAPEGIADVSLGPVRRYVSPPRFGLLTEADLYTPRQLRVMATISELVAATHAEICHDGGSREWADAVTTILGLGVGRLAQFSSTQARWTVRENVSSFEGAFPRNDLPMTWDFYEINVFGTTGPTWTQTFNSILRALKNVVPHAYGEAVLADARTVSLPEPALIATDPPYFEAIGYADLSDYFYTWHRRALRDVHPDLYATVAAPKTAELTAIPSHHGNSKVAASRYFIEGFTATFKNLQESAIPGLPMIIVYASKEQGGGTEEETRWSSILTAIVDADLEITGTWPILGTTDRRMVGQGTNAVASYVVMICRPRSRSAGSCALGDFNRSLRRELKPSVHAFQAAGILPVDLAQAAMGPGMQVYSRYREVVDQSGKSVSVGQALRLINAALGEVLDEQEGELDSYSRFAVAWWEKHGWSAAPFGVADQLARPQGISVDEVVRAGVAHYPRPGFVKLLGTGAMDRSWKPAGDSRPTAWEAVHHLADRLIAGGGTSEAARLIGELGTIRDPAQALVYRLHAIAAKKGWAKDQERYNALIGSWSDLLAISATEGDGLF